jgi:glycosyltransferase involved in cell wall biosynthesis
MVLIYWENTYAKKPDNYNIIEQERLNDIPIDVVLIQQRFGQYQMLNPLSRLLHCPSIQLEHTLPFPGWSKEQFGEIKAIKGTINAYITNYSAGIWSDDKDYVIVNHGIDTDLFKSIKPLSLRNNSTVSVVNDWINRDVFCGFNIWKEAIKGIPHKVYGDTPGLSKPANPEELIEAYNSNRIFVNTSTISPIPTALMEAMACGCAVVALNNCAIPEVIKDGYNGILCNNVHELRNSIISLLENPDICEKLGNNARQTIKNKYNLDKFVRRWSEIFEYTSNLRKVF